MQVTEEQLNKTFADSGAIRNVEWLTHNDTGKFRGAIFAEFESAAAAQASAWLVF